MKLPGVIIMAVKYFGNATVDSMRIRESPSAVHRRGIASPLDKIQIRILLGELTPRPVCVNLRPLSLQRGQDQVW